MGVGVIAGALAAMAPSSPPLATAATAATAPISPGPRVSTDHGCYIGGARTRVKVSGSGFAAAQTFDLTIEGVDFGQSTTDSSGAFRVSPGPGGLPAGTAQHVEHLEVTDGTLTARTSFTLTRPSGARLLASRGTAATLRAPFEAWGFSLTGSRVPLLLHYVSPAGSLRRTVSLGRTGGQCGYLRTPALRVFTFSPSAGTWTLQIDTHRAYSATPSGPVARIGVRVA